MLPLHQSNFTKPLGIKKPTGHTVCTSVGSVEVIKKVISPGNTRTRKQGSIDYRYVWIDIYREIDGISKNISMIERKIGR